MKKIAIISKYFFPVTAGIEVNICETYAPMVERGNDITIHTSRDTLTEKNVLGDSEVIRGINVTRYNYGRFGYWPKIDWQNTDYVCLHNFNVFPHFFVMLYTIFLEMTGRKKYKLFLTPHGGFNPEWSIFPPFIQKIKKFYHFTVGTLLINLSVDGMRAVSEWEKEEMLSKRVKPSIVRVIDNGIEDEAYLDVDAEASEEIKQKVESYGKYIIQIGRVYVIKNYETVIRSLVNTPKDLKYLIVGGIEKNYHDNYKTNLDKLIKDLGLEDRVIFTGVVKGVDKYYLIKHAQMMVHMALWESFCNVVHEGLSQGLVCLVANNTALPYLIINDVNGWCIETTDDKAVAEKINYVLENKESKEILDMQERNREYGLSNSWRQVSERVENFYLETK